METPHAVRRAALQRTTGGLNDAWVRNRRGKHPPSRPRFLTSELNHFRSTLAKPFAVTFGRLRVVTRHWSVRHSQECAKGFPSKCVEVSQCEESFVKVSPVSQTYKFPASRYRMCILPLPPEQWRRRPGGGGRGVWEATLRYAIRDGGMAQNLAPRRRRTTLDTRQYNTVKIRLVDKYDVVTL